MTMDDNFPQPSDTIGSEAAGDLYVWVGKMSGWFLENGPLGGPYPDLVHRCGARYQLDDVDGYLANLTMRFVVGHQCR